MEMQFGLQGNSRLDTLSLLKVGRIREATDPRDKIFSWIGLSFDWNNKIQKPDYSLDTCAVYKRFAVNHYRTTANFELFSVSCLKESSSSGTLAHFRPECLIGTNIEHDTLASTHRKYHAGGPETQVVLFTESDKVLNITGVIIDHVAHLGIGLRRDPDTPTVFPDYYANFAQWLDMTSYPVYYPPNATLPS